MRDILNMIAASIYLFVPSLIILIASITYAKTNKGSTSRLMLWGSILGFIAAFETFGSTWIYPPHLEATSSWMIHLYSGMIVAFVGGICFSIGFYMLIKKIMTQQLLSLIHISEPTRRTIPSRMPSSA